jgi:hypothetical protein
MKRTEAGFHALSSPGEGFRVSGIMVLPLFTVMIMATAGTAFAEQAVDLPKGPVPEVKANLDKMGEGTYMKVPEGVEKKLLPPNHPPISEILPMPMPSYNGNTPKTEPQGPGSVIIHAPATKG